MADLDSLVLTLNTGDSHIPSNCNITGGLCVGVPYVTPQLGIEWRSLN